MNWFIRPRPLDRPRARLFCFPFAGAGGQMYSSWARLLPDDVELCGVQPPGRWTRRDEPAFTEMEPLVIACRQAMASLAQVPLVFFGHSLGALVAYEIARALQPHHLVVSARAAPHVPLARRPFADLPDDDFIDSISTLYGGVAPEVAADKELLAMVLPALRADMKIYEHYVYTAAPALSCPITTFCGNADPTCTSEEIRGWRAYTTSIFECVDFIGPHLFLQTRKTEVLAALNTVLSHID